MSSGNRPDKVFNGSEWLKLSSEQRMELVKSMTDEQMRDLVSQIGADAKVVIDRISAGIRDEAAKIRPLLDRGGRFVFTEKPKL